MTDDSDWLLRFGLSNSWIDFYKFWWGQWFNLHERIFMSKWMMFQQHSELILDAEKRWLNVILPK